ncbi:hypothetical protein ACOJIV_19135 [Haloarcula sp. AONF1]
MTANKSGLKNWAKWLLFFSSYFPLYVIIAVKTRTLSFNFLLFQTPVYHVAGYKLSLISGLFLIFGLLVLAFLYVVIRFKRAENGQPKEVSEPAERNELIITYILVHVVPFAFIDYSNTLNLLAFIFLFLSIGIIQVRSSYLYINPILSAMRYDLYEIEEADTRGQMLLVKTHEHTNSEDTTITAVELSNDVYITTN